jgi:uncharacterized RDD family membrane protein YckC
MNLASWFQRVGAYLVDAIPSAILAGLAVAFGTTTNDDGTKSIGVMYYVFILLALGWVIYNRWILGGQGASIGKKALGLRLIKEETGQPIGAGMAFLRDIAHFVDGIICYIGYLFPLWDAKRQTLADKIVKTLVVVA